MTDLHPSDIRQFRDTLGIWMYETLTGVSGVPPEKALAIAATDSRESRRGQDNDLSGLELGDYEDYTTEE